MEGMRQLRLLCGFILLVHLLASFASADETPEKEQSRRLNTGLRVTWKEGRHDPTESRLGDPVEHDPQARAPAPSEATVRAAPPAPVVDNSAAAAAAAAALERSNRAQQLAEAAAATSAASTSADASAGHAAAVETAAVQAAAAQAAAHTTTAAPEVTTVAGADQGPGPQMAAAAAAAAKALRSTKLTTTSIKASTTSKMTKSDASSASAAASVVLSTSPPDPSEMVLIQVATCDSLSCPAGYQMRPDAFNTVCSARHCSLEIDLGSCCNKEVPWMTYIMAEVSFFCCLSMLCSFLGGLVHFYSPRKVKRQPRPEANAKEMVREPEESDPLDGSASSPLDARSLALQVNKAIDEIQIPPIIPAGSIIMPQVSLNTVYPGVPVAGQLRLPQAMPVQTPQLIRLAP